MSKHFIISLLLVCLGVCRGLAQETGNAPVAYLVGGAHLDSQWNWDVVTTINEYLPNTARQNLFLLERFPSYVFNFEGGVKYAWMKEYYPDLYRQVKQQIATGRWHVAGASWEACEVLVSSSESLIRNILLGQTFYRREFGLSSSDIYLPDCFGFPYNLPTIAAHCNLIGFSTQKLQWRGSALTSNGQYPFTFGVWEGVDGSRIAAAANAFDYSRVWASGEDLSDSRELYDKAMQSPARAVYHYYGTGDIGGSPTIASVEAVEQSVGKPGRVRVVSATSDAMYRDFLPLTSHPELPIYKGEMLMDVHGNACYTSQAAMKLYNRENELLAAAAERAAVVADWLLPGSYPTAILDEAWKRFIWHQFHDDLTGTSIPRAYTYSWNDELLSLRQFEDVLETSLAILSRRLDTRVKGTPVLLYNPSSHLVTDVVEVQLPVQKKTKNYAVYDENRHKVPSQVLGYTPDSVTLLLQATIPPMGVVIYDVRAASHVSDVISDVVATDSTLENSIYHIELDGEGNMVSWYDKRYHREWIAPGESIAPQLFTNNDSFQWPAWEIKWQVAQSIPEGKFDSCRVSLVESGALRATLCVERRYGDTRWLQYISLVAGSDRIEVRNELDWHTERALLKMAFPFAVANDTARYDIGIGSIGRATNKPSAYETYAHRWVSLTDTSAGYGISILSDSKYGWDKPDGHTMRLTLLHTPAAESAFFYQSRQDMGYHTFGYAMVAHEGNEVEAGIARRAEAYDNGLKAFVVSRHAGELGRAYSWFSVDNQGLEVMAFKKAEDGNGYIVRLCEKQGQATHATLSFVAPLQYVYECDGTEIVQDTLCPVGNTFSVTLPAYGVRTYRLLPQPCGNPLQPVVSQPLQLPYNLRCVSYNEFRNTADFDGAGHSFAAELFPDTLYSGGIAFVMGDENAANGMKCLGDTICLPQDRTYSRLYLLAASTLDDYAATFYVDGKPYNIEVPYYSGFIGQWGHEGETIAYLKRPMPAFIGTHRHDMNGNKDCAYEYTYIFRFAIDLPPKARELVLPCNSRIVLFAATLTEEMPLLQPAHPLFRTAMKATDVVYKRFETHNLLLGKEIVSCSGATSQNEQARYAIDGDESTKWADFHTGKPNYIEVDLGDVLPVKGWRVVHAGKETPAFITKNYELQVRLSTQDSWHTVDKITGNIKNVTDRNLDTPVKARYVRLYITGPVRDGGDIARIYEWEVY